MSPNAFDQAASGGVRRLGANLCGKYRLLRVLGVGGMGTVYAARHRNGHPVAIKILHERWNESPDLERQFRREAQLANTVNHPGIVPVTDDDVSEDGCVFLVMPLLEGETLRARWERSSRKLPVEEVIAVAHAVLGALSAAHAAKIVHRDIKPENVFLTREGGVRVLDFGIARLFETNDPVSATRSGRAVGTPAFMAPEQALGRSRDVDGRTDLWALGATMFSLLSGHFVHEAENAGEVVVLAATRPSRPLRELAADVPAAICEVIDRALAFQREARWPDAAAMDQALLSACASALGKSAADLPLPTPPAAAPHDDVADQPTHAPDMPRGADEGPRTPTERLPAGTTRTIAGGTASSTPARRGRLVVLGALGVGAAALIAATALISSRLRTQPSQGAATPNATSATAPSPHADPNVAREALGAYRAGCQAWDDGSLASARDQFDHATAIEPGYADAHLGYVLATLWPNEAVRRHFQAAAQHRSDLSEENREILDAFEPLARHPASFHSSAERMRAVQAKYPASTRVAVALAMLLVKLGEEDKAIALLTPLSDERARLPIADLQIGLAHALVGRVDEARQAFQRCIDRSPSAMTCLADLARLDAYEGLCHESEELARREVSIDSHSTNAYDDLARALFANGQSLETVSAALEREWAVTPPERRDIEKLRADTRLSILAGNFTAARISAQNLLQMVEADDDAAALVDAVDVAMQIDMELGLTAEAGALAAKFMAEAKAKLPDSYADFSMNIVGLHYRVGGIDAATLASIRGAWLERERAREHLIAREPLDWTIGYALPAKTSTEALSAIAALPKEGVVDPMTRDTDCDEVIGRVYLLAGHPDAALPFLKRGAQSCAALTQPISATRLHVLLGEALEATGDRTGACAAYGVVTERWGTESRSLSARRARARLSALSCK